MKGERKINYITPSLQIFEIAVSRGDAIVIVDAIRASTTYVMAFASGADRIIPCSSRKHLAEKYEDSPNSLKCGERLCK